MSRRSTPYALALLGPVAAAVTYAAELPAALTLAGALGFTILADALLPHEDDVQDEVSAVGRWVPRLFVPAMVIVTVLGVQRFATASALERVAVLLAAGVYGTTFGINVAHELIHARSRLDRALGGVLLGMLLSGSFKVEHIRGHHRDVATDADPSSAPRGRSLYAHLPQAAVGNWRKGWALETARLRRRGLGLRHHELLRWAAVSVLALGLGGALAGVDGVVFVLVQGILARLNLEIINYVEHYGLRRQVVARDGDRVRYERVSPAHSWTSEHRASRVVLLNLPRHADHHAHASRPWTTLRPLDGAPTTPHGYPALFLLALVPPLWFRVMDPRVDAAQAGRAYAWTKRPGSSWSRAAAS